MVRTDGPDGKLQDFEIKYVLGVMPLQQYLVELDNGRLQAPTIARDTRDKTRRGQRWFHLYPDETIAYKDELHWTRTNFNWNTMCAKCHSTHLQKNYGSSSDTFQTAGQGLMCRLRPAMVLHQTISAGKRKNRAGNLLIIKDCLFCLMSARIFTGRYFLRRAMRSAVWGGPQRRRSRCVRNAIRAAA